MEYTEAIIEDLHEYCGSSHNLSRLFLVLTHVSMVMSRSPFVFS
jgi:hypothetical protein